jgi:uncharacterized DUF497 family protein
LPDDFDWDEDNEGRILLRQFVRAEEVEEVFFNHPQVRRTGDVYLAVGESDSGRHLLVVFERRDGRIRPYSARDLTDREKKRMRR